MANIEQILSNNGFKYHMHGIYDVDFLVVEDMEIIHCEPLIEKLVVGIDRFDIYVDFKDNIPKKTNFGLNIDTNGYHAEVNNVCSCCDYIWKKFNNENDFIQELHRLNSIGLNIKG